MQPDVTKTTGLQYLTQWTTTLKPLAAGTSYHILVRAVRFRFEVDGQRRTDLAFDHGGDICFTFAATGDDPRFEVFITVDFID